MKKHSLNLAAAAVAAALSSGAASAMTPQEFCTAVGGTYSPSTMVCSMRINEKNTSGTDIMLIRLFNRSESITGGEFYIKGANYSGTAQLTLTAAGSATLKFTRSTVSFSGGVENAFGLGALGFGPTAYGTLTIANGSIGFADGGAWALSVNSKNSVLNLQNTTGTIAGGLVNDGIYMMTSGSGSSSINVDSLSSLVIDGSGKSGIGTMAAASPGSTAQATIANSGSLTIKTIRDEGYGIAVMADGAGSSGTIETEASATTTVTSIQYGALDGGSAYFVNKGGTLVIARNGLNALVRDGGTGSIENNGNGTLSVSADHSDGMTGAFGINALAYQSASAASTISSDAALTNTSSGTISILGGAAQASSAGIMALAYNGGKGSAHAALSNLSSGTIKIESGHGSGRDTAGISVLAQGAGATAEITNGVSGVMTIKGDTGNGGYGIGYLAMLGGVGSIVNNGTLTMDRNAIYAFSDGRSQGHFSNTGTVNTEAELMFESSQSLVKGELPIQLLKPAGDTWTQAEEKLSSYAPSYEATIWKMKEDWAENSTWEGGTLNFTNIDSDSTDAAYLKDAFTSVMGDGVEILFKGEVLGDVELPTGSVPKFTAAHANELIALGYAGSVVTNLDLDLSDAYGNQTVLTVGSDASSQIRDSFGFRKLRGVWSLDVKDGKYFVLAGDASGGSLIEGDGAVTVSGAGTLKLGVESDSQSARGSLSTVSLSNGSLEANNGSFTVSSLRGRGTVRVKERASLDIRDAELSGNIRNEGTLTAQTLKVSKGTLLNSGTLKADGKVTIESTAKLAVDGRLVADSLDIKGVVVKGKRADIVVGAASQNAAAEAVGVSLLSVDAEEEGVHKFGIREPIEADEGNRKNAEPAGERDAASFSHSPASAQAFAAFDAANRIAADIESGTEPDRHGLWVKLQTNDGRFDAVRGSRAFELETDGALVGAETQLTSSAKIGAALAYLDGDIKFNRLNFSWSGYALNLYGAYRSDAFALKATAGWLRGTTEAEKDFDADVWHAGLRAEYGVPTGAMVVTPFMGARVRSGSFDGLASQTVFSIPLGAKLSGTIEAGGWTLSPALEAAYVRSIGDTEAEDVRFLPKDTLRGSIGLKAGKGMWTGELSYVGATGSNGYRSNSLNVKIGLLF